MISLDNHTYAQAIYSYLKVFVVVRLADLMYLLHSFIQSYLAVYYIRLSLYVCYAPAT